MEIDHYKKYSDNSLDWIDITNNDEAISLTSKTQAELLRRLHVIQDGQVIGGAKAFLIIWSNNSTSNDSSIEFLIVLLCFKK